MNQDQPKRRRSATLPIPAELREPFYLAVWDLAWSGHFYRYTPANATPFLKRFGSGSIVARRHGLVILWLTAMAGRFGELAGLKLAQIEGQTLSIQRSKRGAIHQIRIDQELIEATKAWHQKLAVSHSDARQQPRWQRWAAAMHASPYMLPNCHGGRMSVNVFNRDVAGPLGDLFGCKLSSHCFRDTACQEAMRLVKRDANLDVRAVQALMGHKSIRTTEHYLRKQREAQLCLALFTGD